jgi:hypothetical protein
MQTLACFLRYAADFEQTLADDDWTRLERHFSDDAVYRVEGDAFGCELEGPQAIFAGMKKSLDGFDRAFGSREIALSGEPEIEGEELRVGWTVTYHKPGWPDFVLRGQSFARIRDDRITLLVDSYDERVAGELADWSRKTGVRLDPSYV